MWLVVSEAGRAGSDANVHCKRAREQVPTPGRLMTGTEGPIIILKMTKFNANQVVVMVVVIWKSSHKEMPSMIGFDDDYYYY